MTVIFLFAYLVVDELKADLVLMAILQVDWLDVKQHQARKFRSQSKKKIQTAVGDVTHVTPS